jgi:rhodanese-related sulfurtransferase
MGDQNWIINSSELRKILKANPRSIFLLDVREPEEFQECHIDGCTLIPLGELSSRALRELNPEDDIVVYCAHGVRSMHALMGLKQLGFEKVRSLEGGIAHWSQEPKESEEERA